MKPSLQVRLSQHLALTPQLQQSIRLLQLSTLELHQEVEQMLEQNPFLEADEETPTVDDAPPLLRFEIAREGVLLFQRDDHLWTDFKARAMVDWWDWAPTHRMIAAGVVRRLREKIAHGQG